MQKINEGDVVTFTEYVVSQLSGRKRIRTRLENMIVAAVVDPGEQLSRDRIEEYYGENLREETILQLSVSQATRLILKDDEDHVWCAEVAEDFLRCGLQTIEFGARAVPQPAEAPSYLQFLSAFGGQQ